MEISNDQPYFLFFALTVHARRFNASAKLLQLAWIVTDKWGKELESASHLVVRENFTVEEEVKKILAISNEQEAAESRKLDLILKEFSDAAFNARYVAAHNIKELSKVLNSELKLSNIHSNLTDLVHICTMKESTKYCALEPKYSGKYKWPTLAELLKHTVKETLNEYCSPAEKCRATMKCFFSLQKRNIIRLSPRVDEYRLTRKKLSALHRGSNKKVVEFLSLPNVAGPVPVNMKVNESAANETLTCYSPSFLSKVLCLAALKRRSLRSQLEAAKYKDLQAFTNEKIFYDRVINRINLEARINSDDLSAFLDIIKEVDPWSDISAEYGVNIELASNPFINITITFSHKSFIPAKSATRILNGNESVRPIGKKTKNEIFRDFVCSVVLRVIRDFFEINPRGQKLNLRVAQSNSLNSNEVIMKGEITRADADGLDFNYVPPFVTLEKSKFHFKFSDSKGFYPLSS